MTEPPVIVLHLYTEKARTRILNRLKAEKRPEDTKIFLGTYGINELDAAAITAKAIPDVHYAPTFHLAPDENAALRAKRPRPPRRSPTLEQVFAGQLPAHPRDRRIPAKTPRAWGVELGRRFRDQLRQKELKPGSLDWQLDEIPPECGRGELAREFRLFIGGVIFGLAKGRPRLKDKPKPGFVWIAARGAGNPAQASADVLDVKQSSGMTSTSARDSSSARNIRRSSGAPRSQPPTRWRRISGRSRVPAIRTVRRSPRGTSWA